MNGTLLNRWQLSSLLFDLVSVNPLTFRGCSFFSAALVRRLRRYVWRVVSWSESLRLLLVQAENFISEEGLFREWSPMGSRCSDLLLLDVPGTATEQVRICGFRRISSSIEKAHKLLDSVRQILGKVFFVTRFSISSQTFVMYSNHPLIKCVLWVIVSCFCQCFSQNCR